MLFYKCYFLFRTKVFDIFFTAGCYTTYQATNIIQAKKSTTFSLNNVGGMGTIELYYSSRDIKFTWCMVHQEMMVS